ncbi:MAG TPA: BTAD domain-containing putative transcriptional regulator [Gemmatimonadota bacterium]|nr:BTAD domain-containing putative transcriptional regulator [Gemmatimonadota bacterium]
METTLEFRILGPLEVLGDAGSVHVGSAKQRALLGLLLLHANEPVSTSQIVDALWGESPPATADKLVQGYVHALRKQMGDGIVRTRPPGYEVALQGRTFDLAEFERLLESSRSAPLRQAVELRRRALALWRGGALAGVELEGQARHQVARLDELRLSTQIEQIDARLELGQHAELVGELETLVAANPYQERLQAQLMLALYRSGRQADALEHYRSFRRSLDEEIGLQPGSELRELEAAILRHDHELAAPERSVVTEPAVAGEPSAIESEPAPRRPRFLAPVGVVALLLFVAAAVVGIVLPEDEPAPIVVAPNSVAVIDAEANRVVEAVPVGIRPGPVAYGMGSVWVGNLDDDSVTRIDAATRVVIKNIPLPATPDAVTVGAGAVWVVNARLGMLYRVDPEFDRVTDATRLGDRAITYTGAGVDVGLGFVWAAFGDYTLARADPRPPRERGIASAGTGPVAVVVAFGAVWVAYSGDSTVQRFDPRTFEDGAVGDFTLGSSPAGIAAGVGGIWVTSRADDYVTRLDVGGFGFNSGRPIPVGDGPTAVAVGARAVWVANTAGGSVSRIDPTTDEVDETIPIGNVPAGLAYGEGDVWVSIQEP